MQCKNINVSESDCLKYTFKEVKSCLFRMRASGTSYQIKLLVYEHNSRLQAKDMRVSKNIPLTPSIIPLIK